VLTVLQSRSGKIWGGTWGGGLNQFDPQTQQFTHYLNRPDDPFSLSGNVVTFLHEDPAETMWIGTFSNGLNRLDPRQGSFIHDQHNPNDENSLSVDSVSEIFAEKSGAIWVGTEDGGLNRHDPLQFLVRKLKHDPSNPLNTSPVHVYAMCEDDDGRIWMGSQFEGVARYDPSTGSYRRFKHDPNNLTTISAKTVIALCADPFSDAIWLGTQLGGLCRWEPAAEAFVRYPIDKTDPNALDDDIIRSLLVDRNQNLWVGNESKGVQVLDTKTGKVHRPAPQSPEFAPLEKGYIRRIYEDGSGAIWLGTDKGDLFRYQPTNRQWTTFPLFSLERGVLAVESIVGMTEDAAGTFWVATRSDLHRFDRPRQRFITATPENFNFRNQIRSLLLSQNGDLWISTEAGIGRFDPPAGKVVYHSIRDDYQEGDFNTGAGLCHSVDGDIYFGGLSGVFRFTPEAIQPNKERPPVVIQSLHVHHQSTYQPIPLNQTDRNGRIVLEPHQNSIEIHFAALNYTYPEQNQYKYRLKGVDENWFPCGNRRVAYYSPLPPGPYEFQVIGSNNDGEWNENGASVSFLITPPFHATLWFRALLVGLVGTLIALFVRRRIQFVNLETVRRISEEKNDEILLAKDQAEAADQAKSNFLANMSHEIRTPLNAITGLTRLALKTPSASKQRHYLEEIDFSADTLVRLVGTILDFSKIEAGMLRIESVKFDLRKVFDNLRHLFESRASEKGLRLEFSSGTGIPNRLIGDPLRLEQILVNLTSNALKFTNKGWIRIRAEAVEDDSGHVTLQFSVQDTGIGIAPDSIDELFEAFTQADESTTRKYGGTGLGLAISKRLVELLGGKIEVSSMIERGTCFNFTARFEKCREDGSAQYVKEHRPISQPPPSDIEVQNLRGARVLLAEDNLINQKVAQEQLEDLGLRVFIAQDGAEAVSKARRNPYDLILMDVQMPKMDGYQATKMIRRELGLGEVPIIAITAHAMAGAAERCREAEMNDHVAKPIGPEDLARILVKWIKTSQSCPSTSTSEVQADFEFEKALAQVRGNRPLLLKLLGEFDKQCQDNSPRIVSLIQTDQLDQARNLIHSIQGVASNLGAEGLRRSCERIEYACSEGEDTQGALQDFTRHTRAISACISEVAAEDQLHSHRISPERTSNRIPRLLEEMSDLLVAGDYRVVELLDRVQDNVHMRHKDEMLQLSESITRLEFQTAQACLVRLKQALDIPDKNHAHDH
jgi:signal transduction histidine kinase/CheY-like chemotaxis protein/streptogramin lyase/HPt (histidine-containing phosphotransfer) domain-containing protein